MPSGFLQSFDTVIWVLLAAAIVLVVVRRRRRGPKKAPLFSSFRAPFRPWDHEAELIKLCHGDKAMADRLIQHEIERAPGMSRAGAALAAATRLRHDKQ